ncbi:MAG: hypothetical protein QOG05_6894 [Streptosporangiaceae bacterium]|nr:hypothetical protein [Streptosporangiaceae bacterium]
MAVTCVLAGCSAHSRAGGPATSAPASPVPGPPGSGTTAPAGTAPGDRSTWMLTRGALSQVLSDPSVAARLEAARVFEILTPGEPPLAAAGAEPVVTFSAVSALRQAVDGGQLPAGTRAVLYDPEVWPYTPVAEQRNPVRGAREAAAITRAHHLTLIVAPALDLATAQPRSGGPLWRQYLRLNLVGAIARVAGVVEVQAQSLERAPQTYRAFVRAAAAQARAANPHVTVLAGLSTNPPGAVVSSPQLAAAIRASSAAVAGYWLNVPGQGPRCPACNAPRPDIARQMLGQFAS